MNLLRTDYNGTGPWKKVAEAINAIGHVLNNIVPGQGIDIYQAAGNLHIDNTGSSGGGGGSSFPWKATLSVNKETNTTAVTVKRGLRCLIGGNSSIEETDFSLDLTEDELESGVWIVKQFSSGGETTGWVAGIQKQADPPEDEAEAEAISLALGLNIDFQNETYSFDPEVPTIDQYTFPETLKRQRRAICYIDRDGIKQFANGVIYAIAKPEAPISTVDIPEDEADENDEIADCDQNDHPGDDYDDGDGHIIDLPDGDRHPGDLLGDVDDSHLADLDCYTTR